MPADLSDFQLGPIEVFPSQSLLRRPVPVDPAKQPDPDQASQSNADRAFEDVHIEPKVMAVLERLAQDAGSVVSRASLLDDVWAGTVVTEEVVTRCISELRTALGDSPRAPDYIQTIPKKGYRLLKTPGPIVQAADIGDADSVDTAVRPHKNTQEQPALDPDPATATATQVSSAPARPRLYWARVASVAAAVSLAAALLMNTLREPTPTEAASSPATADLADSGDAATNPSIAILPFTTLDNGNEANYFGAGLAEELLNALVNVPGLRVVSRLAGAGTQSPTSTGQPAANSDVRAVAQTLGVDTVLTGSVRRMDNNVRVTAQLINADDGVHMWADQFEGDLSDVFRIQDDIAAAIVGALRLQLTEPVRVARLSADMNALDYYLLGRYHWHQRTPESLTRAIELFKRAAQEDPKMAVAYSGLADAYLLLADYGDMEQSAAVALARPAIDTALELDNTLAEAHASLGMLQLSLNQLEPAEQALRRAVRYNPGYDMAHMWLGSTVAMQGKVKEAHKFYLKAYRLNPLHPVVNQNIAMSFATIGDYDSAAAVVEKFDPRFDHHMKVRHLELHLAMQLGDFDRLRELAEQAIASSDPKQRMSGYNALWSMHSRLGDDQAAAEYLARAEALQPLDYPFRLNVGRKLAREGSAAEFAKLMQAAPVEFHDKAVAEIGALEGMLLIATENYDKAAKVLESAMLKRTSNKGKPGHPANELLAISHLLYTYEMLNNTERRDYWLKRGSDLIYAAVEAGHGQIEFITEVAFFHAAAGQSQQAAEAFWHALTLGKLAPWEITDDIRTSRIQRSDELRPVVQAAASNWTA